MHPHAQPTHPSIHPTANYEAARAMYMQNYSLVPPDILALRSVVLAKKKERPFFVQPHLEKKGKEEVEAVEFPATVEGVVLSFKARFPALDEEMVALWRKDEAVMCPLYCGGKEEGESKKRLKKEEDGGNGGVVATA